MALTVNLNGTNYSVPEPGDVGYDQQLTTYLKALPTAFPQLGVAGTQALTAEWDAGTSFGIKLPYVKSKTANPAASGTLRLARADAIGWRNQANSGDLVLAVDNQNNITFNALPFTGNPLLLASTTAGQSIANNTSTIVVFGGLELDTDSGYSTSTGRYVIPTLKAGQYLVGGSIAFASALTTTVQLSIFKTAVEVKRVQTVNPGAGHSTQISAVLNLAAGDIIDLRLIQASGSAATLNVTAAINFFNIKRILT